MDWENDAELLVAVAKDTAQVNKLPPDITPPTPQALAQWFQAGECPLEALDEASRRLSLLLRTAEAHQGEPRLYIKALVSLEDTLRLEVSLAGTSMSLPVPHLTVAQQWWDRTKEERPGFPITPIVLAWLRRPIPAECNPRETGRFIPQRLAMARGDDSRAGKRYAPAAHISRNGQGILPGFGLDPPPPVSLPLALYQMGNGPQVARGRGAPMALRLFVEVVLAVKPEERNGQPRALQVKLRDLLAWLYPGRKPPGPSQYLPRLEAARRALDDTLIPIFDPETGRHDPRRIVSISVIPEGEGALDAPMRLIVDLPAGSEHGPKVSDNIRRWGARNADAYRLLLNLSYYWHNPGVTRRPVGKRSDGNGPFWALSQNPVDYPPLSDADLVAMTNAASQRQKYRTLVFEAHRALQHLADAGEVRTVEAGGLRVLPPMEIATNAGQIATNAGHTATNAGRTARRWLLN